MTFLYEKLTEKKHMLVGASLIRIAFGLIILYMYLIHYAQRRFLWGPTGLYEFNKQSEATYGRLSLYQLNDSILYFEIIYHLGILVAILFVLGYMGRITAILNFVFVWSLQDANLLILDGGDNVMRIILLYLILANTTAFFSIDQHRNKLKKWNNMGQAPILNAFHNLAILASIVQVSFMYLTSGLHKVMGETWQNGTALYYILQVQEYSHPFFRDLIFSSDILILIGAYGAIFAQVSYPFLLMNRYTKYLAMLNVICMHIGIGVVMGLFTFSATMISIQLLLLTDQEYRKMNAFVHVVFSKFKRVKEDGYEVEQTQSNS